MFEFGLVCFLFLEAVRAGDGENRPGSGEPYEKIPVRGCGDPEKWLMDFEFKIGVLGGRFVDLYASKLMGNLTRRVFDDDHMLIVGINACENWYNGILCAFESRLSDERFPQLLAYASNLESRELPTGD
jgi:hypothetical protein